jgi:nucleoside-diphosphate-sugar epimerase
VTGAGDVLVTGASGFIGRALVRRLAAAGRPPVCTSRHEVPGLGEGVRWVTGDLTDAGFVARLLAEARPSVVYHLASAVTGARALDAVGPTRDGILVASVNVLQAVTEAGCDRLVLIGSGDEPEGDDPPCSPYAAAKWAVGGYARMFGSLYGTPVTTARTFMVYGPDQPDRAKVVPYAITSLLGGEAPRLTSGQRSVDWVYVEDVVDALVTLARAPGAAGRALDVGSGLHHTVRQVVEKIAAIVGGDAVPAFGDVPDRPAESERVADIAETERVCGWTPTTGLDEGLERTVAWYAEWQARNPG